jgi:hypothetical protein
MSPVASASSPTYEFLIPVMSEDLYDAISQPFSNVCAQVVYGDTSGLPAWLVKLQKMLTKTILGEFSEDRGRSSFLLGFFGGLHRRLCRENGNLFPSDEENPSEENLVEHYFYHITSLAFKGRQYPNRTIQTEDYERVNDTLDFPLFMKGFAEGYGGLRAFYDKMSLKFDLATVRIRWGLWVHSGWIAKFEKLLSRPDMFKHLRGVLVDCTVEDFKSVCKDIGLGSREKSQSDSGSEPMGKTKRRSRKASCDFPLVSHDWFPPTVEEIREWLFRYPIAQKQYRVDELLVSARFLESADRFLSRFPERLKKGILNYEAIGKDVYFSMGFLRGHFTRYGSRNGIPYVTVDSLVEVKNNPINEIDPDLIPDEDTLTRYIREIRIPRNVRDLNKEERDD